jgi:Amt family ammonium transporter
MSGMVLTGLFASKAVNAAGANGLFYGETALFLNQLKGLAIVVTYSFVMGFIIFKLIDMISPLRVSAIEEEKGLDESQHGEKYVQGTLLVSTNGHIEEKERGTVETNF